MKSIKRFTAIGLAIMLGVASSACGNNTDKSGEPGEETNIASADSKSFSVALSENPVDLDPLNVDSFPGFSIMNMVYDTLVESDHQGNYTPCLAESWENSDDGLEWEFTLRQGVKFHNGEEFTATDVEATFQRLIDEPELACASTYWTSLSSVEVVDDYKIKLKFKESFGPVLYALSNTWILPDEAYKEMGEKLWTEQKCYGTGPWVFDKWVDGQYTHFTKNTEYWGDFDSYYDEVTFKHILEPSTAIAAQLTGEIQAYTASDGIPADMLSRYDGTENDIELRSYISGTFMYLGFQMEEGSPFADEKVRKAFELGIDRQGIIDSILGGGAVPSGILMDCDLGYDDSLEKYQYDPDKAKQLLEESGYDGSEIILSSNTSTMKSEDVLLAISDMLNSIGFNTSVKVVEAATLREMRATGDYDVFMVTNCHPGGDPYSHLNYRILNDGHHSNYKNQELFDLISATNGETDPEVRAEGFTAINQMIRNNSAPQTVVAQLQLTQAVNYGVTGMKLYTDGYQDFKYVTYDSSLVK